MTTEDYGISLLLRFSLLGDSDLAIKVLACSPQVLVVGPGLLAHYCPPELPADLSMVSYID